MLSCPNCQSSQLPNTLFCDQCGEELAPLPKGIDAAETRIRVEFLDNHNSITLPRLPHLIFGRSPSQGDSAVDVSLDQHGGVEGGVSRRHARLIRDGLHLYLEDLGSTNGTFINERPLPEGQTIRVYPGDVIQLGLLRLTFRISAWEND